MGGVRVYAWALARQAADGAEDAQLAVSLACIERDEMGLGVPVPMEPADLAVPRLLRRWVVASVARWADERS